jgi:hypothetical protein
VWFRENIRDPLRDQAEVLFATIAFRWFNLPATAEHMMDCRLSKRASDFGHFGLFTHWNRDRAVELLTRLWDNGKNKVFTGAYMIKAGNGPRGCKIGQVCDALELVWQQREQLLADILANPSAGQPATMQNAHWWIKRCRFLGGFMSYEVVCDLRYTYILENAPDKLTWSNMGPGAQRGLNRILGRDKNLRISKAEWLKESFKLLTLAQDKLSDLPPLEAREIEHSLCEFDKYERARLGDGRLKRKYPGV